MAFFCYTYTFGNTADVLAYASDQTWSLEELDGVGTLFGNFHAVDAFNKTIGNLQARIYCDMNGKN